MKIYLYYLDEEMYQLAKKEFLDPEMMGLNNLWLTVTCNDYETEIIIDDQNFGEIVRIDDARTYFGIYFINGNCFEDNRRYCNMEIRFR